MEDLKRLITRINKHLPPTKRMYIDRVGGKIEVQTIEGKKVFTGFSLKETELLLTGFYESAKILKPKK